jgi:hypothetical protein
MKVSNPSLRMAYVEPPVAQRRRSSSLVFQHQDDKRGPIYVTSPQRGAGPGESTTPCAPLGLEIID